MSTSLLRRLPRRLLAGVLVGVLVGIPVGIAAADVTSDPGPFTGCLSLFDGSISQVTSGSLPFGGSCTNGDDTQITFSNAQAPGTSVSHVWHIAHTGGGGASAAGFTADSGQDIPAGTTITYDPARTIPSFVGIRYPPCAFFSLTIAVSDQLNGDLKLQARGRGGFVFVQPGVTIRGTTGTAHWTAICRSASGAYLEVPDFSIDVYFQVVVTAPFS
jgi:hypothetical protein